MESKSKRAYQEPYRLDRGEKNFKLVIGPLLYFLSLIATGYSDLAYTSKILSWGISSDTWGKFSLNLEKLSYK